MKLSAGCVKIGEKPYEKAKWKFDKMLADEMEYGYFSLATLLDKNISTVGMLKGCMAFFVMVWYELILSEDVCKFFLKCIMLA